MTMRCKIIHGYRSRAIVDRDIVKYYSSMQADRSPGQFINLYDIVADKVVQLVHASSRIIRVRTHFVDGFFEQTVPHSGRTWFELFDYHNNQFINAK